MKAKDNDTMVNFITSIQFTKRALKEINGITFLFDPNWQPGMSWQSGVGGVATLPLSVFHVVTQQEILESDVNQKQMLFYNNSKIASAYSTTGGQTEIVADNIIIKPKTYKLDILLPATGLGSGAMLGTMHPYQSSGITSFLATKGATSKGFADFTSIFEQTMRATNIVYQLVTDLIYTNFGRQGSNWWKEVGENITSTPNYNKDSIEAMWRNRGILKMKTWNDWRYKYVVIKSLDIKKDGKSSGVYEGTLVVQEINIMTVRRSFEGVKPSVGWVNPAIKLSGNIIKAIINGKEGK